MPDLFSAEAFSGFGPDHLHLHCPPPHLGRVQARRPSGLRSAVRLDCPRRPGVYGMIDHRGDLIYIGKARCLRSRLLSYFRPKSRDPKAGAIITRTRRLAWEVLPTELSALLRELELIRRWQPAFNVAGQPRRRRPLWLCLGRRPAPYVFSTPKVPATALAAFGPLPGGSMTRESARRVNDWFRLRDCPHPQEMIFAEQQELFPIVRAPGCIRLEINACLGPCAAACTLTDYQTQVDNAKAFLEGKDATPLAQLDRDMQAASAALQFERAAVLRDRLTVLGWLSAQLDRLRQARELSFIYPLAGHDGKEWWYVIRRGEVRGAAPASAATAELIERLWAGRGREEADRLLLVAAWFRKRPQERQRALAIEACRSRLCDDSI
jgi:excinuclease ABC subunit C